MASFKDRLLRARLVGDAGLLDATDAMLVRNLQPTRLGGDYTGLAYADGLEGADPEELRNQHLGVSFEVDGGWGAAAGTPPAIAPLLQACGMTETVNAGTSVAYSMTPQATAKSELELAFNLGGQMQAMANARGSLSFTANAGARPFFSFNYMGAYAAPVAEAWPAADFSGWKPGVTAVPANMQAFTLGGTFCVREFSFTDGRTPMVNKFMNCDGVDITRRAVTGRMQVEMPDIATRALVEQCRTGVTFPLTWEINRETAAEGALRIAAPKVQLKWAGEVDLDGTMGANIDLIFLPDQGDDDLSIIFKAQEA
jgi:hypothetical protein